MNRLLDVLAKVSAGLAIVLMAAAMVLSQPGIAPAAGEPCEETKLECTGDNLGCDIEVSGKSCDNDNGDCFCETLNQRDPCQCDD